MFQVTLYRYQFPFLRSTKKQPYRQGYILRLVDEHGFEGLGEIAPLPGFSQENLADTLQQIKRLLNSDPNTVSLYPSVAFGFESAYMDILAKHKKCSMNHVLFSGAPSHIRVNAFLSGSLKDCVSQAKSAFSEGFTTFKLKVGHQPPAHDIELIRAVSAEIGAGFLRLDANQHWSLSDAIEISKSVSDCPIDYVEEPLQDASQWQSFFYETGFYIGIDETVWKNPNFNFQTLPEVKAVILKPTLIGGIQRCLDLAEQAQLNQKLVVMSASFESPVGVNVISHLASVICPGVAHGLDMRSVLVGNTLQQDLALVSGTLHLETAPLVLNYDHLEKVDLE